MVVALYPTVSNPPTFGMILGLKYIEDMYEKIFIVVEKKSLIFEVHRVVAMLEKVLCKDSSKYSILLNEANFENLTIVPKELPEYDIIITDNPRVYANLINKGYVKTVLIPRPIGWDETLHRIATQRSLVLEKVLNTIRTINNPNDYVDNMKKEIEA